MPTPIHCCILRGGTSKGVYLREADLPSDPVVREQTILRIFGSPDKRQIDGVGAFAIWEGMVPLEEPVTRVHIYNTNLDRMLFAEVPVRDGRPLETGDYAIPGVPGTGAKI